MESELLLSLLFEYKTQGLLSLDSKVDSSFKHEEDYANTSKQNRYENLNYGISVSVPLDIAPNSIIQD